MLKVGNVLVLPHEMAIPKGLCQHEKLDQNMQHMSMLLKVGSYFDVIQLDSTSL